MPRNPDLLCAGGCGQLIWRSATSLPEGQARCHSCRQAAKPPKIPADTRTQLRRGYEEGDLGLFTAALRAKATITPDGCWVWVGRLKEGYPQTAWGGKVYGVHRLVLGMKHGASLGTQVAHHVCADTRCVNPDHLQPVTSRENIAEMLARRSYLARIAELEEALAELEPSHPLLAVIRLA